MESGAYSQALQLINQGYSNCKKTKQFVQCKLLCELGLKDYSSFEKNCINFKELVLDLNFIDSVLNICFKVNNYAYADRFLNKFKANLELRPEIFYKSGLIKLHLGQLARAKDIFILLKERGWENDALLINLAQIFQKEKKSSEAISCLIKVSSCENIPSCLNAKGNALYGIGKKKDSADCFLKLYKLTKRVDHKYKYLNILLETDSKHEAFFELCKESPPHEEAARNWIDIFRKASLQTNNAHVFQNMYLNGTLEALVSKEVLYKQLSRFYRHLGDSSQANKWSQMYSELSGDFLESEFMLELYRDDVDDVSLLKKLKAIGKKKYHQEFALPNPEKEVTSSRVKLGFISADFYDHPVMRFFIGILRNINKEKFQIFIISSTNVTDSVNKEIRRYSHRWLDCSDLTNQESAKKILSLNLDLLVDLSGHTDKSISFLMKNRLAITQISHIGYPFSMALKNFDYKILDGFTDPVGMTEKHYVEKIYRMPDVFSVYTPDPIARKIKLINHKCNKRNITFASYNNLLKVTDKTIVNWAGILDKCIDSVLIIKAKQVLHELTKQRVLAILNDHGISEDRIFFQPNFESKKDYFDSFSKIDVMLDTFPYNGTTTTCDSLYMGVPVVTLQGSNHRSRVSSSQLTALGLKRLITKSPGEYIRTAVTVANDTKFRSEFKLNIRAVMEKSSLMDSQLYTQNYEKALIHMFNETRRAYSL